MNRPADKKKGKRLFLLCFWLVVSPFLFAQNQAANFCDKRDSLFQEVDINRRPDESIPILKRALNYFEEKNCPNNQVYTLNALAVAFYNNRAYASAWQYAEEATQKATQYPEKTDTLLYAASIANLAIFYEAMGNYQKSIHLQEESLRLEKDLRDDAQVMTVALENLGNSYQLIGDIDIALSYFEQALEKIKQTDGDRRHESARLIRQLAACYKDKNKIAAALEHYQQCQAILETLQQEKYYDQTRWYAAMDLADIYLQTGQAEKALDYVGQALVIQRKYQNQAMLDAHKPYLSLGKIYLQKEDSQKALGYFQKALTTAQQEFSIYEKHPAFAASVAASAKVYAQEKAYQKAIALYEEALDLIGLDPQNPDPTQLINPLIALDILAGKAQTFYQYYLDQQNQDALKQAFSTYQHIAQVFQHIRQIYLSEGSKHSIAERAIPLFEEGIEVALELHQLTKSESYLEQAFYFAESNKSMLLYEAIRDDLAKGFAAIPDSLLEAERDLRSTLSYFERRILESQQQQDALDQPLLKEWQEKVFNLKKQVHGFTTFLEKQYPDYYELKYKTDPISVPTIREQLVDEDNAIVEFMLGKKKAYVFFLSKKQIHLTALGSRDTIAKKINQLRTLLIQPPGGTDFKHRFYVFHQTSHELYQLLLAPGLAALNADIQHLMIVPDDVFSYLPFEVLLSQSYQANRIDFAADQLAYLFEQYRLSYHYSATLMAALHSRQWTGAVNNNFIGFAPSFENGPTLSQRSCSDEALYNLQCNEAEVRDIQSLVGGSVFLGEAAHLQIFQQEVSHHSIIHLATHSCINENTPALNTIFLSQSTLTQFELSDLRLNAALTVLSACNTGNGQLLKGEGVMSLARSFILAGSQSVLTSLWSVDDCATSKIMLAYYRELKKGENKAEAIRKAKLTYLEQADLHSRHPYYWAAFVQYGDIQPLRFEEERSVWLIGLISLLGLLFLVFYYTQQSSKRKRP